MDAHLIDPPSGQYTDNGARCVHCRKYKDEHQTISLDQEIFVCLTNKNYEFEPDDGERERDPDARRDER